MFASTTGTSAEVRSSPNSREVPFGRGYSPGYACSLPKPSNPTPTPPKLLFYYSKPADDSKVSDSSTTTKSATLKENVLFKVIQNVKHLTSLNLQLPRNVTHPTLPRRLEVQITRASIVDQHTIQKQETKYSIKEMMRLKHINANVNRTRSSAFFTPEDTLHEIQSILNKLTDSTVVSSEMMTQIVDLTMALKDVSSVVSIIYPKSISERKSTTMYANICHRLSEDVGGSFTTALVDMCTADFNDRMEKRRLPKPVIENDDQFADFTAEKTRESGNLIIIGALFRRSIFSENLVTSFLDRLAQESAPLAQRMSTRDPEVSDEDLKLTREYAERSFECLINLIDALRGCSQNLLEPYIKKITCIKELKVLGLRLDTLANKLLNLNWNEKSVVQLTNRRLGMSKPVSESERTGAVGVASPVHTQEHRPATQIPKSVQTRQPSAQTRTPQAQIVPNSYSTARPKPAATNGLFQKKADFDIESIALSFVELLERKTPAEDVMTEAKALKGTALHAIYSEMLSIACSRDGEVRNAVVAFVVSGRDNYSSFTFVQNVLQGPRREGEHAAELVACVFAAALLGGRMSEGSVCDALKMLSHGTRTTAHAVLPLLLGNMKKESFAAAQSMFSYVKSRLSWVKEDSLSAILKEDADVDERAVDSLVPEVKLSGADPLTTARRVFGYNCVGDPRRMAEVGASLLALRTESEQIVLTTLHALVEKSAKWVDGLLDAAVLRFNEEAEDVEEAVRWLTKAELVSNEDFIKWADVETPTVDRRKAIPHLLELEDEVRRATEWDEEAIE